MKAFALFPRTFTKNYFSILPAIAVNMLLTFPGVALNFMFLGKAVNGEMNVLRPRDMPCHVIEVK